VRAPRLALASRECHIVVGGRTVLILALLFFVLALVVLRSRRGPEVPNSSKLYRIDNRVVASVLAILGAAFALLAWSSGRLLF
jgi:hypothetical protein